MISQKQWKKFQTLAKRFEYKAKYEDRLDLRHSIILRLAELQTKRDSELSTFAMLRIANLVIHEYWYAQYRGTQYVCVYNGYARKPNIATCEYKYKPKRSCLKCGYIALRPSLSLDFEFQSDSDSEKTNLYDIIADDTIDLDSWLNARMWLKALPKRLVKIAVKKQRGIALNWTDYKYLERNTKKISEFKQLALV